MFGDLTLTVAMYSTHKHTVLSLGHFSELMTNGLSKYAIELPLFFTSLRYHDHWRFALQRLSFVASFVIYLETGKLATRSEVAQMIGGR